MGRRSGTGQIVDPIHFELEGFDDIMANQLKSWIARKMLDVGFTAREKIIETDNFVPLLDKTITEMGSKESGSPGNEYAHRKILVQHPGLVKKKGAPTPSLEK